MTRAPLARRQSAVGFLTPLASTLVVATLALPAGGADLAVNAYVPFPVGSPRVMGMAGAFTGIATGAEALLANPTAVLRPDGFSIGETDLDYMFSFTNQEEGANSDFGNVGEDLSGGEAVLLAGMGGIVRWGGQGTRLHGLGLHLLLQSYFFTDDSGGTANLSLICPRFTYGTAFGPEDDFLVSFAVESGTPRLEYEDPDLPGTMVKVGYEDLGAIPIELGFLWAPPERRYQFGARIKGPSVSQATERIPSIDPFPGTVVFPGEFSVGAAYTFGERMPEGAGEWFDRATVDLDLRGILPVAGTTGFERFRSTDPLEMLNDPLLQPSLGVEIELYTRTLWLWLGTYREPARYEDVEARWHRTAGFKVRLFQLEKFGLYFSLAADNADRFGVWTSSLSTGPGKF